MLRKRPAVYARTNLRTGKVNKTMKLKLSIDMFRPFQDDEFLYDSIHGNTDAVIAYLMLMYEINKSYKNEVNKSVEFNYVMCYKQLFGVDISNRNACRTQRKSVRDGFDILQAENLIHYKSVNSTLYYIDFTSDITINDERLFVLISTDEISAIVNANKDKWRNVLHTYIIYKSTINVKYKYGYTLQGKLATWRGVTRATLNAHTQELAKIGLLIFTERPITVEDKHHNFKGNLNMYVAHDGISIQEAYEMELEQVEIKNKRYYAEQENKLRKKSQAIHNENKDALKQRILDDKETRNNITPFTSPRRDPFERRM